MIQYFILFLFHYVIFAFFIVCRASFSRFILSLSLIYPQKSNLYFPHSLSSSHFLLPIIIFACLCFQQCMSLIAKIFLPFISISFFMLSWIRGNNNTKACVCVWVREKTCLTHNKSKSKKRRSKNDIYLPFSSGKIKKFNFVFLYVF